MLYFLFDLLTPGNSFIFRQENGISQDIFILILVIFYAFTFFIGLQLRKGKEWTWDGAIIISIICITINTTMVFITENFNIFYIFLHFLFIYYLYRPHVKAYFNKGKVTDSDIKKWKKDKNIIGTILIILGIIFLIITFLSFYQKGLFYWENGIILLFIGYIMRTY